MCDWTCSCVSLLFSLLCSSYSWGFPLQFVKDLHLGFHPTTSWYHEPWFLTKLEPPFLFSSLILLRSSPISKIPTKNSPNFFLICWFDEVLLILIHGFAWFRVDLPSPHVSPPSIHEIFSILTPNHPISE